MSKSREIIDKAMAYAKTKKKLDRAKERLNNCGLYLDQDSIENEINSAEKELEELTKRISLVEAFEVIASLKEDLDDAHVCMP